MNRVIKATVGWISAGVFLLAAVFYFEGFILYSFNGNLGFPISFFGCPVGIIGGIIGRKESKLIKVFGMYGNIAAVAFGLLYWPLGYIIEIFINRL